MHIYVLYCIVSIHSYSASCNAHQSDALPVRETQREDSTTYIKSMCLYSFIHSFIQGTCIAPLEEAL